jgi:hypothetical protein
VCHVETVCFRIPDSWLADTEANGDGVYWDPQAGAATLRVTLITGERKAEDDPIEPTAELQRLTHWVQSDAPAIRLANGNAFREAFDPDGPPDTYRFFVLHDAHPLIHVAHFSLNVRADGEATALHSLVRDEIKAVTFEKVAP